MPSGCWRTRASTSPSPCAAPRPGSNHLGIQVENEGELAEVYARLNKAGAPVLEEGKTTCCYAQVREILDRRSGRHLVGDVPDHGRIHRLRQLAAAGRAGGGGRVLRRRRAHDHAQRAVPLHGELGALDHGRIHPAQGRRQAAFTPSRPAACPRARSTRSRSRCWKATAIPSTGSPPRAGRCSPGRTRREWISS